MSKAMLFLVACFCGISAFAKEGYSIKYAVFFKDKANSPYSIQNPSQFLSQRAIDRRNNAGIKITEQDLPVNPSYISQVQSLGFNYVAKANWNNYIIVGTNDEKFLPQLKNLPFVKNVVEIYNRKSAKTDIFSVLMDKMENKETKSSTGDNLQNLPYLDYGTSFTQVNMLGIDYMHSKGYTGKDKIIAVFDGGFFKVNELGPFTSLRENNQILRTWDFVMNDESVYEDLSHGMSVLSCIAGIKQGQLIGTGPGASFFLLRTEDGATETLVEEYNWEAAAVWADSAGADIINSSLGYTQFDNGIGSHTYANMDGNTTVVTKAADLAASKGILVVNSAGNEGASMWHYIGAPADGDSVLAIGAVNRNRKIAGFSSRGPSYDGRVKPNVCAVGEGTMLSNTSGDIVPSNGTSFSGPLIAGAAACLWQANPDKTNMQIFDAIQRSAHKYSSPDNDYGYGIPNFGYADLLLKNLATDAYYKEQKLLVYPNPVKENEIFLDFFSQSEGTITIKVSDLNGKIVATKEQGVFPQALSRINVQFPSILAAGTYVVSIHQGKQSFSAKFVKQ
jgi:serine protease AprX